jgi:hypothetical protein
VEDAAFQALDALVAAASCLAEMRGDGAARRASRSPWGSGRQQNRIALTALTRAPPDALAQCWSRLRTISRIA